MLSYWETEVDDFESLPFALKRLNLPSDKQVYDVSGVGLGNDVIRSPIISEIELPNVQMMVDRHLEHPHEVIAVKYLPLSVFRQKLIRHFNIAFQRNEISWPKRMKEEQITDISEKTSQFRNV